MRALAGVLMGRECRLSGSDAAAGTVEGLAARGLRIYHGHAAEYVPDDADLVIYSDAVAADNPELRQAVELGIPAIPYAEAVGRLMRESCGLAVAGTHGKSTTTAMAAEILIHSGADPTVVCGATPCGQNSGGRYGHGRLLLAEACEYRANFLRLRPREAVILGIEPDHFDFYADLDSLQRAFAQFAQSVARDGWLLVRDDCEVAQRAAAAAECHVETFGTDADADWTARVHRCRRGRYEFAVRRQGRHLCDVALRVPGRHNVLNALAAAALSWENGATPQTIAEALAGFRGLRRRLELLGTWRGVTLIDDYAHHPTEVAATLETVRQMFPGRPVWCVFQPHQVSRTARLLDELAASLQNADKVLVAEIFRAREASPQPGEVAAADLARQARRGGVEVADIHLPEEIVRRLQACLRPGDVLVTMGAGDIGRICHGFADGLRGHRAAG
jgi:UDP-N-acetylmuramate--alanine ligase